MGFLSYDAALVASDEVPRLHAHSGLHVSAHPDGCIGEIARDDLLINQIVASPVAGGVQRAYLRVHQPSGIEFAEIVGPNSTSAFAPAADRFEWSGTWRGIGYRCTLRLHSAGDAWFWHVEVENQTGVPVRCDAVLLQDLGLASRGQVRNNELFTSQYLDHFSVEHPEVGHVVMTRQNLPQANGSHPWLMQGCFPAARGFTTDGFDFFGAEYRGDGVPRALSRDVIGRRVRQYETAYVAVQSDAVDLKSSHAWTFFAHFVQDHREASSKADLDRLSHVRAMHEDVRAAPAKPTKLASVRRSPSVFASCELRVADELAGRDIERLGPGARRHDDGGSFFVGDDARHVVLRRKELSVARPHGHILRAGRGLMPDDEVMSTTCYAAGVFASQLALGNASLARLLSGVRDPLNVVRSSGLRIFVRHDARQAWQLLGVPSALEMALDRCTWHYQRGEDWLTVTCAAAEDRPQLTYDVHATGRAVEVLACGEVSAGPAEYESSPRISIDRGTQRITVRPDERSILATKQPQIEFHIESTAALGRDERLFDDGASRGLPYFTIYSGATNSLRFTISGSLGVRGKPQSSTPFAFPIVRIPSAPQLQDTLTWFARDAIVHLATPRGLEQPNGGAWGVRDVCQGPVEFLLAHDRADDVREIVRTVFAQQYAVRGDWPQWFMFPPFQEIQSRHAHGDVVIWPLKSLCDYLEHSNDGAILHERVAYTDDESLATTDARESILQHADRALQCMRDQFLPGLALPHYGDGDWDDSLQPADPFLRERMVSAWTAELMYQTVRRYGEALAHFGETKRAEACARMAHEIESDFQRHLMPDGVVAGFAVFDAGAKPRATEYLLHPSDRRTGLKYRLIPMSRGILSGIFTREQAQRHLDLIRERLLFPDGARLMDRPTQYCGGIERTFRRSESAAFFGREIGLQYIHAHLRYAEALAVMGRADELWRALLVASPIAVTDVVSNARPRQRNCYFSSSDAAFSDRGEASRDYDKLRRGEVPVDGGWRIYSSGPGIYTSLVLRYLFGLRRRFDQVVFDPILPRELSESCVETRGIRWRFRLPASGHVCRITVNDKEMPLASCDHVYRAAAVYVPRPAFVSALRSGENTVEISG